MASCVQHRTAPTALWGAPYSRRSVQHQAQPSPAQPAPPYATPYYMGQTTPKPHSTSPHHHVIPNATKEPRPISPHPKPNSATHPYKPAPPDPTSDPTRSHPNPLHHSPAQPHHQTTTAHTHKGLHLLMEKPMSADVAEGRALLEMARARPAQVFTQQWPWLQLYIESLISATLGYAAVCLAKYPPSAIFH